MARSRYSAGIWSFYIMRIWEDALPGQPIDSSANIQKAKDSSPSTANECPPSALKNNRGEHKFGALAIVFLPIDEHYCFCLIISGCFYCSYF